MSGNSISIHFESRPQLQSNSACNFAATTLESESFSLTLSYNFTFRKLVLVPILIQGGKFASHQIIDISWQIFSLRYSVRFITGTVETAIDSQQGLGIEIFLHPSSDMNVSVSLVYRSSYEPTTVAASIILVYVYCWIRWAHPLIRVENDNMRDSTMWQCRSTRTPTSSGHNASSHGTYSVRMASTVPYHQLSSCGGENRLSKSVSQSHQLTWN